MQDLSVYAMEIEIMKITLGTLHYRGLEIQPTVKRSVEFLVMQYELLSEREYLEIALIEIAAYLEMGGIYKEEQELFDKVMAYMGLPKEVLFPVSAFSGQFLKPNKYQIRKLLGRWMPSRNNPMKIGEVVDDILDKIKDKKQGHYYYKYEEKTGTSRKSTGRYLYELVVAENECYFYDVKNNKYYRFY